MPRIDPLQLLKCLSVLLAPNGGIKSKEEVQRLASLMTKFSKKLVSKCIYIQILKTTKTDLLGMFMAAGGWNLIHMWLSDAIIAKNWPLIQELLELLLMCPVDVERLKTNTCPKLIKGLSKDGSNENVKLLASKLVEQWLRIVKGECAEVGKNVSVESKPPELDIKPNASDTKPVIAYMEASVSEMLPICDSNLNSDVKTCVGETISHSSDCQMVVTKSMDVLVNSQIINEKIISEEHNLITKQEIIESENEMSMECANVEPVMETLSIKTEGSNIKLEKVDPGSEDLEGVGTWNGPVGQLPVYKITIRDGKQVLAKVYSGERTKKLSDEADPSEQVVQVTDVKNSSVCSSTKIESAIVECDNIVKEEEEEVKTEDIKNNVISKLKLKSDSSPSENVKSREIQKKGKDLHSNSKVVDKKSKSSEMKERSKDKEGIKEKSKDKGKEKDKNKEKVKDKEKEKSKEKENKDKKLHETPLSDKGISQADKDKATLAKLIPPAISKVGKIPKKIKTEESSKYESKSPLCESKKSPDTKKTVSEVKRNSISIEVRNKDGSRPKTVKKFNSKFRSTGLEEEVKPPPSRIQKKPPPLPDKKPVKLPPLKRPSPPKETTPLEKKMKHSIDVPPEEAKKLEKPGSIKLIPSKPKRKFG